jgi:hypothetical protein
MPSGSIGRRHQYEKLLCVSVTMEMRPVVSQWESVVVSQFLPSAVMSQYLKSKPVPLPFESIILYTPIIFCYWRRHHVNWMKSTNAHIGDLAALTGIVLGISGRVTCKKNSMASVRKRTIPTERPPIVSKVSANFLRIEDATWSAWRIPTAVFSAF